MPAYKYTHILYVFINIYLYLLQLCSLQINMADEGVLLLCVLLFESSYKDTCFFCILEYPWTVWALVPKERYFQGVAVDRVLQGPAKIPAHRDTEQHF